MITDHAPVPGPDYWSWKCRVCGEDVEDHRVAWYARPGFAFPAFILFCLGVAVFATTVFR